jgi:hypothetical protein
MPQLYGKPAGSSMFKRLDLKTKTIIPQSEELKNDKKATQVLRHK